jgi:AcrR family transcriptional regulator
MGISDALDDELPQDSLGQKGASTRGRLMASARRLLAERSAVGLTSLAIAQGAGMSAASFYNYFVNVEAIIHALCVEAGAETRGIVEAARLRPGDDQQAIARRFVDAYDDHWRAFRPVLSVRNMEAERGNIAFQLLRPATGDAEIEDRSGQIAVAVAAIERLAPAAGLYLDEPNSFRRFPRDLLRGAQVDLLADALGSEPKGG